MTGTVHVLGIARVAFMSTLSVPHRMSALHKHDVLADPTTLQHAADGATDAFVAASAHVFFRSSSNVPGQVST